MLPFCTLFLLSKSICVLYNLTFVNALFNHFALCLKDQDTFILGHLLFLMAVADLQPANAAI